MSNATLCDWSGLLQGREEKVVGTKLEGDFLIRILALIYAKFNDRWRVDRPPVGRRYDISVSPHASKMKILAYISHRSRKRVPFLVAAEL